MEKFMYVIKDAAGLHARPAGLIVKEAKKYQSRVTVSANGKQSDATRLMSLMGMCLKCGDEVTVEAEGADETECLAAMRELFVGNL